MLQTEKSSELFYIHLSILSRAYCTQLYLWLSSQRQYKSQKSVQLGSVLNVCRFQQLSKYYQVKRRGINRLSVTSSAELNWIRIKECNRFSTLNNLYCYTNLNNSKVIKTNYSTIQVTLWKSIYPKSIYFWLGSLCSILILNRKTSTETIIRRLQELGTKFFFKIVRWTLPKIQFL